MIFPLKHYICFLNIKMIILKKDDQYEIWGSLTEICDNHKQFSYHYLKRLKFPINYKGFEFIKVPYRFKTIR